MNVPANLQYTEEHEWLDLQGDTARVGITAHASDALGDIVFVDLPDVGSLITVGESCGELESTKSVSDLFAPASGEVLEVNEAVVSDPSLVNTDPFGGGWLFVLRVSASPTLLAPDEYARHISS